MESDVKSKTLVFTVFDVLFLFQSFFISIQQLMVILWASMQQFTNASKEFDPSTRGREFLSRNIN
jgi:hypothetical protein